MGNRLDVAVKVKFNYSREYSKEIIMKGYVSVNGKCIKKPSFKANIDDEIILHKNAKPRYVSRGGEKLFKALSYFNIDVSNKKCLDIGASTGGFSDCLLQNGAESIVAVDIGTAQLHSLIKGNEKVISFENTDIRTFSLEYKVDFICIDVSFISVVKVLKTAFSFLSEQGDMVILVKPQFEAGQKNINKQGVVKNKKEHIKAIKNIDIFIKENGLGICDITYSPIKGAKGNIEYLVHVKKENISCVSFDDIVYDAFLNFDKEIML